jgi:hypothetical protein
VGAPSLGQHETDRYQGGRFTTPDYGPEFGAGEEAT